MDRAGASVLMPCLLTVSLDSPNQRHMESFDRSSIAYGPGAGWLLALLASNLLLSEAGGD